MDQSIQDALVATREMIHEVAREHLRKTKHFTNLKGLLKEEAGDDEEANKVVDDYVRDITDLFVQMEGTVDSLQELCFSHNALVEKMVPIHLQDLYRVNLVQLFIELGLEEAESGESGN